MQIYLAQKRIQMDGFLVQQYLEFTLYRVSCANKYGKLNSFLGIGELA
jgi:hypothetical protein